MRVMALSLSTRVNIYCTNIQNKECGEDEKLTRKQRVGNYDKCCHILSSPWDKCGGLEGAFDSR